MPDLHSRLTAYAPRRPEADRERAELIIHVVAFSTGVAAPEITAPGRASLVACEARALAMYLAHTAFSWPLWRVGFAFGRDRTTVGHACKRMEERRDDKAFDAAVADMETCLRAAPSCAGAWA